MDLQLKPNFASLSHLPPPQRPIYFLQPPMDAKNIARRTMKANLKAQFLPVLRASGSVEPKPQPESESGNQIQMSEGLFDMDSASNFSESDDEASEFGLRKLMEEEEAIMGDDEGKNPMDYNRRAHIFDQSSRVFRAIKDRDTHYHQRS